MVNYFIEIHLTYTRIKFEINSDIDTDTTDQKNHHIVVKNCTNSQFTEPEKYVHSTGTVT